MSKISLGLILFLMISSILRIEIMTIIYIYMPVVIIVWILNLNHIKFSKIYFYEFIFILSYMYIVFSSLWSISPLLSLKLIIGELVLLATYFILRYLMNTISLEEFECLFIKLAKYFTIISLSLYVMGILYYYIFNITPSTYMYLNAHSVGVFGLYLEGDMPRLRGLAESPNIYVYSEFLVAMFFIYKRMNKWGALAITSIILTWSATGLLALLLVIIVNSFNKKYFLKIYSVTILIVLIVIWFYFTNEYIHNLIIYRFDRILTGSGRFDLWSYLLGFLNDSPIFGYGANSTRVLLENLREYQSAHNSFLDIFVTTGIIGLFIEVLLFVLLFWVSYRMKIFYKTNMFINLWILYFIVSMSNNVLHIGYTVFYLCFLYMYYNKMQNDLRALEYAK